MAVAKHIKTEIGHLPQMIVAGVNPARLDCVCRPARAPPARQKIINCGGAGRVVLGLGFVDVGDRRQADLEALLNGGTVRGVSLDVAQDECTVKLLADGE